MSKIFLDINMHYTWKNMQNWIISLYIRQRSPYWYLINAILRAVILERPERPRNGEEVWYHKLCNRVDFLEYFTGCWADRRATLPAIPYISHDYPTTIVNVNSRSARERQPEIAQLGPVVHLLDTRYIRAG